MKENNNKMKLCDTMLVCNYVLWFFLSLRETFPLQSICSTLSLNEKCCTTSSNAVCMHLFSTYKLLTY